MDALKQETVLACLLSHVLQDGGACGDGEESRIEGRMSGCRDGRMRANGVWMEPGSASLLARSGMAGSCNGKRRARGRRGNDVLSPCPLLERRGPTTRRQ